MEESIKLSDVTLLDDEIQRNSRTGWLEKHAELIAKLEAEYQSPHEVKDDSLDTRFYGFTIANLNLLISDHISSEILEDNIVYPIPLTPNWLLGACNVRGDIVPIIDLAQIIAGEDRDTKPAEYKTLVLEEAGSTIGLPLIKLPVPIHFKEEDRVSNYSKLPDFVQPFITLAYKRKQNIWVCINFSSFISSLLN